MTRLDKWLGGLLLGAMILILFFCAGWWLAFLLGLDAMTGAIGGAVIGIAADIVLLWWLIPRLFSVRWLFPMVVYLLYSVFIYGFFMGVPVFIAFMGLIAGWYVGRRYRIQGAELPAFVKARKRTQAWCGFVLLGACMASAYIALTDPTTPANLQGMLGLPTEATQGMIWGIILGGGAVLLLIQALLVRVAATASYKPADGPKRQNT